MNDPEDRTVCLCFNVPLNKIKKHIHLNNPKYVTQLSECFGCGTGCGWCVPFLEEIFNAEKDNREIDFHMTKEEYIESRKKYHLIKEKKNNGNSTK